MRVLSLFDGMSCAQIALKEQGIAVERYYASEVDKHAIQQTQHNFPDTVQLGDVTKVDVGKLGHIDLLCGGSPCQSFSFAGKRKGMATKCEIQITKLHQYLELKEQGFEFEGQSYLFWEYMRILTDIRKYNPDVKFLLENVEMGKKWERILSEAIGVFGVHINSNLVSAQNRARIYWTNIRIKRVGLFGELYSDIPQPADRGILLRDILEDNVDDKYYISEKGLARIDRRVWSKPTLDADKTGCLSTVNNSGRLGLDSGTTLVTVLDVNGIPKLNQDKSACFTAGGHSGRNHSDMDLICVAQRGRENGQELEPLTDGKTNTITGVQKDNLVATTNYLQAQGGFDSDNRFWYDDGKHASVLTRGEAKTGVVTQNRIRRLTPTECSRLQTVPAWYQWICSDTQQYRMLGNGWTIEIIKYIFSFIKTKQK